MPEQKVYYAGSCQHEQGIVVTGSLTNPRMLRVNLGRIGEKMVHEDNELPGFISRIFDNEDVLGVDSCSGYCSIVVVFSGEGFRFEDAAVRDSDGKVHELTELDPNEYRFENGVLTLV